jgi:hypothetical protein
MSITVLFKQHELQWLAAEQILTEQPERLALSSFLHTINRDPAGHDAEQGQLSRQGLLWSELPHTLTRINISLSLGDICLKGQSQTERRTRIASHCNQD